MSETTRAAGDGTAASRAAGVWGDRPHPPTTSAEATVDPQEAFVELGRLVVGSAPLTDVLHRVAELAKAVVPGAEEVSVTLLEQDEPRTAAFTGELAHALDERQYEAHFGPCLDAAQAGSTIRIDDTGAEDVYPAFAAVAARQGVRSVLAIGMPMPQRILGCLNVYRFDEGVLDEESAQLLHLFGDYAAVALANHALYASSVDLSTHLHTAMQSRAVIEQAKGVLSARLGCTPEDAFLQLVRLSQTTQRKLRDVAADVVRGVTSH